MNAPGDNRGDRYEVLSLCRPLLSLILLLFAAQAFAQTSIGITPGVAASTSTSTVNGITMPSDFSTSTSGGVVTVTHSGQTCNSGTTPCTVTSGWLVGDANGGNVTYNLPVANAQDLPISTCKSDSSVNTVTMHRNGTDTISGAASDYVLSTQHQCVMMVSTSAGNWSVRSERWASGSMPATQISGTALTANNNLSDLTSVPTALTNLTLGSAANANLPVVGAPGSFSSLVDPVWHAAPTASGTTNLTCTGISGNFPYNDVYSGALSGNNVTYNLPTSGCADFSIITEVVEQDAAHTLTNTTSASGGITGTQTWTLGTSAGNLIIQQFMWFSPLNAWFAMSVGTNPVQAFPVPTGGTGRLTLTNHSVLLGAGTGAITQLGPDSSTGKPLISQGSSSDPAYGAFTFSASPNLPNTQFITSGTSFTVPASCTLLAWFMCGGGGGGGGVTTSGSTACSAASGSGSGCLQINIPSPSSLSPISYTIGGAGTAGSNGASPSAGSNGGDSTIVLGGVTITAVHGVGGGTQNAACTSAPGAPTGNSFTTSFTGGGTGNLGIPYDKSQATTGNNGVAGSASANTAAGGSQGVHGGNAGHVSSGGVSDATPQAGGAGYVIATCYQSTAF